MKNESFRIQDVATIDEQIDNFGDWLIEVGTHLKASHESFESATVDYIPKSTMFSGYLSYTNACKLIIVIEKGVG